MQAPYTKHASTGRWWLYRRLVRKYGRAATPRALCRSSGGSDAGRHCHFPRPSMDDIVLLPSSPRVDYLAPRVHAHVATDLDLIEAWHDDHSVAVRRSPPGAPSRSSDPSTAPRANRKHRILIPTSARHRRPRLNWQETLAMSWRFAPSVGDLPYYSAGDPRAHPCQTMAAGCRRVPVARAACVSFRLGLAAGVHISRDERPRSSLDARRVRCLTSSSRLDRRLLLPSWPSFCGRSIVAPMEAWAPA